MLAQLEGAGSTASLGLLESSLLDGSLQEAWTDERSDSIHVHLVVASHILLDGRVLARILKMPVQNNSFKVSACTDLTTNLPLNPYSNYI